VEEEDKLFLAGRSTVAPSSLPESCRELLLLL
jgi:chorismate-pyruvate lyase